MKWWVGFVIVLALCVAQIESINLLGTGASLPGPLYVKWIDGFFQAVPEYDVVYVVTSSGIGKTSVNGTNYIFAGSDSPFTAKDKLIYPGIYLFPVIAAPLVFSYNSDVSSTPLVMTADTLNKIFIGAITTWNDPQLVALNPSLASVPHNITIILRTASSGTTNIWTTYLTKAANFSYGPVSVWPKPILSRWNVITTLGENAAVFTTIQTTPYSCSFGPLSYAKSLGVPFSILKDSQGRTVRPDAQSTLDWRGQVKGVDFNTLAYDVVDRTDHPDAVWPIVGLSFLMIRQAYEKNCTEREGVLKYFYWALNSDLANSLAKREGYLPLGAQFNAVINPDLLAFSCNGKELLSYEITPKNLGNAGSIIVLIASLLCFIGLPVLAFLVINRFQNTSKIFVYLLVIASMINYGVSVLWYVEPVAPGICEARLWLTAIGVTLLLSAVFNLTLQYYFIKITYSKKNNISSSIPLQKLTVLSISFFMAVQIIVLIIWTAYDPFTKTIRVTNADDWIGEYICTSKHLTGFLGFEAALFFILIIFGIFSVTYTWKLLTKTTRWVVMCIYNSLVAFVVVLVYLVLSLPGDSDIYVVINIFLIFITIGFDLAVLMTKMVDKESSSKSNSNSAKMSSTTLAN